MTPAIIALVGVIASSTIGGLIAFFVAAYKSRKEREKFERQISIELEENKKEMLKERTGRKIDIAYKYAELNQRDPAVAETFMNEIAKETAIGFLYLNDSDTKSKVWIRNDANILIGRAIHCDICLPALTVSREHCVIHTQENQAHIIPLNPTNQMSVDERVIKSKTPILNQSKLEIGPYEFVYFQL